MLQQTFDILWEAAHEAAQRISDFFRRIGEWAKEVSQKVLRAYAGNMAVLYGLATEKQIRLMHHRRPRIRKKWYHIILRRIRRFFHASHSFLPLMNRFIPSRPERVFS